MPLDYYFLGEIENMENNNCLDTYGRKSGESLAMTQCHGLGGNQVFAYTKKRQIMSDDNCIDASDAKSPVKLIPCHGMGGNQMWDYSESTKNIVHKSTGLCLDKADSKKDSTLPQLKKCDESRSQKWVMNNVFEVNAINS